MKVLPLLTLENVCYAYDESCVLDNISFSADQGEYLSIVGPNGSGKSTLLKIMCGYYRPEKGAAHYRGQSIHAMSLRDRAKHFAVIHQQQNGSLFPYTGLETVIMGLHPHRGRLEPIKDRMLYEVEQVMGMTDTLHLADKLVSQISGGELQRVMLARAIVQKPEILFLDEAMSGLDICARISMTKILGGLVEKQGITVVAINHDLDSAYRFSSRIVALNGGTIADVGEPEKVMTEEFFRNVFGVKAEILKSKGFVIHDNINKQERERIIK